MKLLNRRIQIILAIALFLSCNLYAQVKQGFYIFDYDTKLPLEKVIFVDDNGRIIALSNDQGYLEASKTKTSKIIKYGYRTTVMKGLQGDTIFLQPLKVEIEEVAIMAKELKKKKVKNKGNFFTPTFSFTPYNHTTFRLEIPKRANSYYLKGYEIPSKFIDCENLEILFQITDGNNIIFEKRSLSNMKFLAINKVLESDKEYVINVILAVGNYGECKCKFRLVNDHKRYLGDIFLIDNTGKVLSQKKSFPFVLDLSIM